MPCAAATRGTLSIIAESKPIETTMIFSFLIVAESQPESSASTPVDSKAATLKSIPRKKRMLGVSIFISA
jgi:hypothetical protein